MEEPPTQDSRPQANREVPRSRTPRATFSTPEPTTPPSTAPATPGGKPAERAPRRQATTKPAPAVTFQPPPGDGDQGASDHGTGEGTRPGRAARKQSPRSKPSSGTGTGSRANGATPGQRRDAPRTAPDVAATPSKRTPAPARAAATPPVTADTPQEPAAPQQATPQEPAAPQQAIAPRAEATAPVAGAVSRPPTVDAAPAADAAPTVPATGAVPAKATKGSVRRSAATRTAAVPAQVVDPAAVKVAPAKRAPRKAAKAAAVPAQQSLPLPGRTTSDATSADVGSAPPPVASQPVTSQPVASQPDAAEAATPQPVVAQPVARYGWATVLGDPGHLPELLALAAVETIGPRAEQWAKRVRGSYPSATPQGIARLAVAQFTRRGGVGGALAAVAGSYAPVALLGAAAWTHAELVLHVAAAHGQDPTDQARAADLLLLTRVHATREDAEAALAAASQPGTGRESGAPSGRTGLRFGRPLATQVGGWLAVRAVNRVFPGTGVLVAALGSRGAAETLGVRAITFYQGK